MLFILRVSIFKPRHQWGFSAGNLSERLRVFSNLKNVHFYFANNATNRSVVNLKIFVNFGL